MGTIWLNKVGRANFSAKMLKMWKQFFRLLIFIGISGGHDMHDGLRERKFKFEDSGTVKLLRHLVDTNTLSNIFEMDPHPRMKRRFMRQKPPNSLIPFLRGGIEDNLSVYRK